MSDLVAVKRALISVSDKAGLAAFATALVEEFGVTLLSTGGTAKFLRDAGLAVTDVSDVTGFPEMMDGRVKTLHPKIHGGLLAVRDNPEHVAAMAAHGIEPIDLVCINLYPFEQTVAKPDVTFEEAIENIDIGGPSMVRSAAKNHASVAVLTSPAQYDKTLGDLRKHDGSTCEKHRLKLATQAFVTTSAYDGAISAYLLKQTQPETSACVALRYGENPHQKAELRRTPCDGEASVAHAIQHHGKELSYINVLDADAALACVKDFDAPAACMVKHATPCGVGSAATIAQAVERAYASDPVAAFGGIVAVNVPLDRQTAEVLTGGQKFLEVIVAPSYAPDALELLKARWKNVRLLETGPMFATGDLRDAFRRGHGLSNLRSITGGWLAQEPDRYAVVADEWKTISTRPATPGELADLHVAWLAVKHVKSNAITLAHGGATVGIGGGQVDRVGACRIAIEKAGERAKGAVAASDAFFPFPDGPKLLLDAGVTAIVQPGGSVRDQETIDLCNAHGAALIFTGRRHFRH